MRLGERYGETVYRRGKVIQQWRGLSGNVRLSHLLMSFLVYYSCNHSLMSAFHLQRCLSTSERTTPFWITRICPSSTRTFWRRDRTLTGNLWVTIHSTACHRKTVHRLCLQLTLADRNHLKYSSAVIYQMFSRKSFCIIHHPFPLFCRKPCK